MYSSLDIRPYGDEGCFWGVDEGLMLVSATPTMMKKVRIMAILGLMRVGLMVSRVTWSLIMHALMASWCPTIQQ